MASHYLLDLGSERACISSWCGEYRDVATLRYGFAPFGAAARAYLRHQSLGATDLASNHQDAHDAWNQTQQDWLTAQLTDADANAKYTFVSKHHPTGNTDQPAFQQIYNLVISHKSTLFLNGHSHEYKHYNSAPRSH